MRKSYISLCRYRIPVAFWKVDLSQKKTVENLFGNSSYGMIQAVIDMAIRMESHIPKHAVPSILEGMEQAICAQRP